MRIVTTAALLTLAAMSPAMAQDSRLPVPGGLIFALSAGPEFDIGSEFHNDAAAGPVAIESQDWGDVYDYTLAVQGEVMYGLTDRMELGLAVAWSMADGKTLQAGSIGDIPLTARFDDYQAWTVLAQARRFFELSPGFFPYFGLSGGVRRIDGIGGSFSSAALPGLGLPETVEAGFYDATWAPTFGITFGWRNTFQGVGLGLETGIFYDWEPKDDDETLSAIGLAGLNDTGERLYIPVKLVVSY